MAAVTAIGRGAGKAMEPGFEPLPLVDRERRMHVRAYHYWQSLLAGRPMPALADCAGLFETPFAGHVILLDRSGPGRRPGVRAIGAALARVATAPEGTKRGGLAGELIARIPAIVARRAPVSFEADLPAGRDVCNPLAFRGILLPLTDDEGGIGHLLGVVSWRETDTGAPDGDLAAAVASIDRLLVDSGRPCPWTIAPAPLPPRDAPVGKADRLTMARTWASLALADVAQSGRHLHAALASIAEACAGEGDEAVGEAVESVFAGTRRSAVLGDYVRAIVQARRIGATPGRFAQLLNAEPDGVAGFLARPARIGRSAPMPAGSPGGVRIAPLDPARLIGLSFAARQGKEAERRAV